MKKVIVAVALAFAGTAFAADPAPAPAGPKTEKVCKTVDGKEVCKEKKRPVKKHNTSDVKKDAKK